MIDWTLAERVASFVAGTSPAGPHTAAIADLPRVASDSERRVLAYSALAPTTALPAPEAVNRSEWVQANLGSMRGLMEPLVQRLGDGLGPMAGPVRSATGVLLAAQLGALTGYMAQRVLGQYEMPMLDPGGPTRLLLVAPNLSGAARELDAKPDELLAWVAFHEVTHAVQFSSVAWLREHMASLVRELLDSVQVSVDPSSLLKLPSGEDLRALVGALREGDLVTLMAGPDRRELIDRLQSTMAMIEGHAEHVMDAVGAEALPSLERMRSALNRRRRSRPPVLRLLERLLGMDMKMRQYEIGKRFCDAVVADGGVVTLNRAWESPESLPTLAELEDPPAWLARTAVPVGAR